MNDEFDDIRPNSVREIPAVLKRFKIGHIHHAHPLLFNTQQQSKLRTSSTFAFVAVPFFLRKSFKPPEKDTGGHKMTDLRIDFYLPVNIIRAYNLYDVFTVEKSCKSLQRF